MSSATLPARTREWARLQIEALEIKPGSFIVLRGDYDTNTKAMRALSDAIERASIEGVTIIAAPPDFSFHVLDTEQLLRLGLHRL